MAKFFSNAGYLENELQKKPSKLVKVTAFYSLFTLAMTIQTSGQR